MDGRRRLIVGALVLAAAILVVVAVAMLAGSGAEPAAAAGAVPAAAPDRPDAAGAGAPPPAMSRPTRATHVVRAGDTMWAIALRYRGRVAHDEYLAALLGLNGGAALRVGQVVVLP